MTGNIFLSSIKEQAAACKDAIASCDAIYSLPTTVTGMQQVFTVTFALALEIRLQWWDADCIQAQWHLLWS